MPSACRKLAALNAGVGNQPPDSTSADAVFFSCFPPRYSSGLWKDYRQTFDTLWFDIQITTIKQVTQIFLFPSTCKSYVYTVLVC